MLKVLHDARFPVRIVWLFVARGVNSDEEVIHQVSYLRASPLFHAQFPRRSMGTRGNSVATTSAQHLFPCSSVGTQSWRSSVRNCRQCASAERAGAQHMGCLRRSMGAALPRTPSFTQILYNARFPERTVWLFVEWGNNRGGYMAS